MGVTRLQSDTFTLAYSPLDKSLEAQTFDLIFRIVDRSGKREHWMRDFPDEYRELTHALRNQGGYVIVASIHEQVIAYVVAIDRDRGTQKWIEIQDLYVSEQHRRQGIARRLIEQAIETAHARGIDRASVVVSPNNKPALGLYEHFGFVGRSLDMEMVL